MPNRKPPPDTRKEIYHIQLLVYLVAENQSISERIYRQFSQAPNWFPGFWLLTANNAFFEAVSITHTLIASTEAKEIRIYPALQECIDKIPAEITTRNDAVAFVDRVKSDYPIWHNYCPFDLINPLVTQAEANGCKDYSPGGVMGQLKNTATKAYGIEWLNKLRESFEKNNFHKFRHQSVAHKNKFLPYLAGQADRLIDLSVREEFARIVKDLRTYAYIWFNWSMDSGRMNALEKELDKLLAMNIVEMI